MVSEHEYMNMCLPSIIDLATRHCLDLLAVDYNTKKMSGKYIIHYRVAQKSDTIEILSNVIIRTLS